MRLLKFVAEDAEEARSARSALRKICEVRRGRNAKVSHTGERACQQGRIRPCATQSSRRGENFLRLLEPSLFPGAVAGSDQLIRRVGHNGDGVAPEEVAVGKASGRYFSICDCSEPHFASASFMFNFPKSWRWTTA